MTGVRFYLEFPTSAAKKKSGKTNTGHAGNVFAAFTDNKFFSSCGAMLLIEGLGAVHSYPNSPVAATSAAKDAHIRHLCKRIPETLARQIHPALFERLDKS